MSWTDRITRLMPEPASAKDLRSFGLIIAGACAVIGLWPVLRHAESPRVWLLALSGVSTVASLVLPWSLRYPYRVWMLVGHCLGWVNTRIIMTVLFYGVITPAALVMRLMKRDAMMLKFDPGAVSYRVNKSPRPASHLARPF